MGMTTEKGQTHGHVIIGASEVFNTEILYIL